MTLATELGRPARAAQQPHAGRWHRVEYMLEAAEIGLFMVSACVVVALVEHPSSPLRHAISGAVVRRILIGIMMGLTAIALVYSPWGKRSGAHMNPALTVTFLCLGKIAPRDALAYVVAQCAGALAGVGLCRAAFGAVLAHPSVNFVVTRPGPAGALPAFCAELGISALLMLVVLATQARPRLASWTGVFAGALVAIFIAVEAPISGMSMNPARTLGSASWAAQLGDSWIYCVAPPLGMALAALIHVRLLAAETACAKLVHEPCVPCIFCGSVGSSDPPLPRRQLERNRLTVN